MKAVGIILAGGNNERLGDLTLLRATAAMPIGSCYRTIDFTISNMSNSGISKVAVITQYNSRSLHDHLSSAKWWDLGRKQGGLFVFTPFISSDNSFWFRGTADSIYQNLSFLRRSNEPYVVLTSGDTVYKMDYNKVIEAHIKKGSDITVVSRHMEPEFDLRLYGVMETDGDGRVLDFDEKPLEPAGNLVSLGVYVISRSLLVKLLETVIAEGRYDFVRDVICRYRKKLKIQSYNFDGGYWRAINSVKAYYNVNMDFLKKEVRDIFFKTEPYIETKPKDEPPAKLNSGAHLRNALVGSGCIINGTVENSVLFRKITSNDNTVIRGSIIMEGCLIGKDCVIENAVLDKEVILGDGKHIIGSPDKPMIVRKGSVL
ncbi:MAG: glucose-1-phosphate adenylyltransferase subunit GlgD [Clostridiales bacterium]|jgi:glucose-1-phosphate adenylyltransferase|nr:glucose-1-phosphate adenylyltransferase subunit GlgD [Clostridiales bacterium]